MRKFLSSIFRRLLYVWVRTTVLPAKLEALDIDESIPVVYVLNEKSYADFLVLEHELKERGMPRANQLLSVGRGKKITTFFSAKNSNKKRLKYKGNKVYLPKHLFELISGINNGHIDKVQLVPVYVRWGLAPDTKEKSLLKAMFLDAWLDPGIFRKLFMMLVHGKKTIINFSQPIVLEKKLISGLDDNKSTQKILRVLRVHFRRQEEAMVGPDLSHRRTLFSEILVKPKVVQAIENHSKENGLSVEESKSKAYGYANEIASDYSYATIRFLDILLSKVWNQIYNGVDINGLRHIRKYAGTHELVYVPCHRSHIDYLLLSYVLYKNGFATPYIAAGNNLDMPVAGNILRGAGAFFMRRSFKDNRLYATVFSEYLAALIRKGHAMEYFVEGGRSRTGRLLPPKMGMLSMTVKAAVGKDQKPVAFIPVYIGYEKIMEIGSYIGELYGKKKQKESLGGVLTSLKRLKEDFGRVHLRFGDAILLNNFMKERLPNWQAVVESQERSEPFNAAISELGNEVITQINSNADVNSSNLLALAMLGAPNHIMDKQQLLNQIAIYKRLLSLSSYDAVTVSDLSSENIVKMGVDLNMVSEQEDILGNLIRLDQAQALSMTYFRNNSLHIVAIPALLACICINNREVTIKQAQTMIVWLYPFLRAELFVTWSDEQLQQVVTKSIAHLESLGLIIKSGDSIRAPSFDSEQYLQLRWMGHSIRETVERYYLVVSILNHQGSGVLTEKELEELARLVAQRLSQLHSINAPDFYDKTVIHGFLKTLQQKSVLYINDEERICYDISLDDITKPASRILGGAMLQQIHQITQAENDKILAHIREQYVKEKTKRLKLRAKK